MHVLVAYSRPRGKYGRYIFTIMISFSEPMEYADISVRRNENTYACGYCGKWATITISSIIAHSQHQKSGKLELFRYDNVEPGDDIRVILKDTELLFYQDTTIDVASALVHEKQRRFYYGSRNPPDRPSINVHSIIPTRRGSGLMWDGGEYLYEVMLIDWDEYIQEAVSSQREIRIEEELIRQTMNAKKITITDLQLVPHGQPLQLEGQRTFIEGELHYLL